LLGNGIRDDAAERVAASSNFLELVVAKLAIAKGVGQDASDLDFERSLNGLNGVRLVGFADS